MAHAEKSPFSLLKSSSSGTVKLDDFIDMLLLAEELKLRLCDSVFGVPMVIESLGLDANERQASKSPWKLVLSNEDIDD